MNETERILDVNLNRACEGLRVLEDMARFFLNREDLTEELKVLRHRVRKIPGLPYSKFLEARNAAEDPGPVISAATGLDGKEGLESLLRANFRRAQEALRCAEEMAKAGAGTAGRELEQCRFVSYDLEKRCLAGMFRSRFIRPFRAGGLYGLTDSLSSRGRSNEEMVRIMTGEGIRIIQYREKDLSQRERFRECEALRRITEEAGAVFIVNDHIDLALAAGADGVHLGQDDLSMEQARALCGDRMIIGRSTHSPEQARQAVLEGADYIGVGPVYATKTKRDVCDPVGLTYLDHVVRTHDIPFVAIGGIKARNMADVASQGARLIALVTEITGAEDPAEVIRQLRKIQLRSFTETETNKEFIHES